MIPKIHFRFFGAHVCKVCTIVRIEFDKVSYGSDQILRVGAMYSSEKTLIYKYLSVAVVVRPTIPPLPVKIISEQNNILSLRWD